MQQVSSTAKSISKKRNKITYVPKQLPDDPLALTRLPSVLEACGMSKTAFHNGIKQGEIPPGRLLSPRCRVFVVGETREWLKKLKDGCSKDEIKEWVKSLNSGCSA